MDVVSKDDRKHAEPVEGAHLAQLAAGERMSIQYFEIEPGATVPEHSHPHEQTGFLYQGTATFLVDGEELTVGAGDSYAIPSEEPHGVENRGDRAVIGIDIFSPPRVDVPWAE